MPIIPQLTNSSRRRKRDCPSHCGIPISSSSSALLKSPRKFAIIAAVTFLYGAVQLSDAAAAALSPMASSRRFTVRDSDISPRVVRVGDNVTFTCRVDGNIAFENGGGCLWNAPDPMAPVAPRIAPADSGIVSLDSASNSRLECNFLITAVKAEHHGLWACNPIMENNDGISANDRIPLNLTVAVRPNPPYPIFLDDESKDDTEIAIENEERNFTCGLQATRPAPQFYWYLVSSSGKYEEALDLQDVQWSVPNTDKSDLKDLRDYYSNVTLTMNSDMNSKLLRCYTDHMMLGGAETGENFTDITLSVRSAPKSRQCNETNGLRTSIIKEYDCEQHAFYFRPGKGATISVIFSAYPEPTSIRWIIPSRSAGPFDGTGSESGLVAKWGRLESAPGGSGVSAFHPDDENSGGSSGGPEYWDRGDLYWANLTFLKFRSKLESEGYALEISNGVEFDDYDDISPPPAAPAAAAPAAATNNGGGAKSGGQKIYPMPPPLPNGITPRHTVVRRIQFGVRSTAVTAQAGLGGGAVAGIVMACLAVVIIVIIVVVAKMQGLLCFRASYTPGLNSYFRSSLDSWRKRGNNNNANNRQQRYDGVATKPAPGEDPSAVDYAAVGARGGGAAAGGGEGAGGSTTATVSDDTDDQPPPPRPPKGPHLRDYRTHSKLSEGEDVV